MSETPLSVPGPAPAPVPVQVWPIRTVQLDSLRNFAGNPRKINDQSFERLTRSIRTHGFMGSIVVNETTEGVLEIVAGHMRAAAARAVGLHELPASITSFSSVQEAAANIAHNAAYGTFDAQALRDRIFELQAEDYALDDLALPPLDLETLLEGGDYGDYGALGTDGDGEGPEDALGEGNLAVRPALDGDPDPPSGATSDDTVDDDGDGDADDGAGAGAARADGTRPAARHKLAVTSRAQAGQLWSVGPHRIICGDCRDESTLERLFEGALMNLIITSPPYADRRVYDATSPFRPIAPDAYVEWYEEVSAALYPNLAPDGSYFLNIKPGCENGERLLYVSDLLLAHRREWGWRFIDEFAWVSAGVPGAWPNRFKNGWEPVYHFARGKAIRFRPEAVLHESDDMFASSAERRRRPSTSGTAFFTHRGDGPEASYTGMARPSNVLRLATGSGVLTGQHEAEFPVGLPAFFIQAYSDAGDSVYDPFLGAGTVALAAHQHGRRAYGAEISPAYVDLALARLEEATGLEAVTHA